MVRLRERYLHSIFRPVRIFTPTRMSIVPDTRTFSLISIIFVNSKVRAANPITTVKLMSTIFDLKIELTTR